MSADDVNNENKFNICQFLDGISVQIYNDYRVFLTDLYKKIQEDNPKYSYRKFSKDLGFTGSGYIGIVLKKERNLSSVGIKNIIKSLRFTQLEASYFEQLVYFNQEKGKGKKLEIKKVMESLLREHEKIIIDKPLNYFLSNRMCSVIALLVDQYRDEFRPDPLWIMRKVRIETTLEEINAALHFLVKNGAIERNDGAYKNMKKIIGTTEDIKSSSIQHAHKRFLNESIDALTLDVEDREFGHITVLIDQSKFKTLKNRIKEFKDEVRKLARTCDTKKEKDKLMLALNVQLYPISTKKMQKPK